MSIQQRTTLAIVFVLLLARVRALSVFPGSPCYNTCNGGSATSPSDIVCTDNDFANTDAGKTLSSCLTCLHGSDYQNGFMTDSTFFIFYLSSIQQTCLEDSDATSSCSSTCSNLASSFSDLSGRNQIQNPYAYCSANSNAYSDSASQCATCLQSNGSVVLGNVVYVGELGCQTTPSVQNGDTIAYSGNPFAITALGSSPSSSTTAPSSSAKGTAKSTSSSSSHSPKPTTTASSSSSGLITGSVTVVLTATVALTPSSTSNVDGTSAKSLSPASLSRGAAAGIGIALGLIGIAGIIALAVILRRRQMRKNANFQRMSSPAMVQRGATPPAAGVFLPPGHRSSTSAAAAAAVGAFAKVGIGKSIAKEPAPKDVEANEAVPKHSKSFKSATSRSWMSKNMTPRTSAWFYAANPKKSSDLTALPQPSIAPGMDGIPELPSSRGTMGRGWE